MLTQTHVEDVIDLTRPFNNLLRRTTADVVDALLNQYILDKTENENGDVIAYSAQPPNPNFPQITELVDRLVNSEFSNYRIGIQ